MSFFFFVKKEKKMSKPTVDKNAISSNMISLKGSSVLNSLPITASNSNIKLNESSTGSTGSKSLDDIFGEVLGKLKLNMQAPEFSSTIEERMDKFMSEFITPFFSQQFYSMSAGLFLGAAVISGLMVGTALSAGIFYQLYYRHVGVVVPKPSATTDTERRRFFSFLNPLRKVSIISSSADPNARNHDVPKRKALSSDTIVKEDTQPLVSDTTSDDEFENSAVSFINVGGTSLLYIRGDVRRRSSLITTTGNKGDIAKIQCEECFRSVEASLSKNRLSWSDVRKLTVFLVLGECNIHTVRGVMEEYPFPKDRAVTTFLFVQRLEIEHAVVQMEVIAASSTLFSPMVASTV